MRDAYMCVGVELIHNELAVLHTRALPELRLSAVCSCRYNYCLTDLASHQHLSTHREWLNICCPDITPHSIAMQYPDGPHLSQTAALQCADSTPVRTMHPTIHLTMQACSKARDQAFTLAL